MPAPAFKPSADSKAPAPLPTSDYIRNPFTVGLKGVNLMFLNAQGVAIFLIVIAILSRFSSSTSSHDGSFSIPNSGALLQAIPFVAGIGLVAAAIFLVMTTFINGMASYAGYRVAQNETATFSEAFRAVWDHLGDLLWLQLLMSLKLIAWSLLLVVPGIIMSVRYSFAFMEYFAHGHKGNAAIKASIGLSQRAWLTIFASQIVFNVVTLGFIQQLVVAGANTVLYRQLSTTTPEQRPAPHGLSIATLVVAIIVGVSMIAVIVLALYDLHALLTGTPSHPPLLPSQHTL